MNQGKAAVEYEHSTVLQLMPAELIPAPTYKQLMTPIKDTNSDLYNYLDARYWST